MKFDSNQAWKDASGSIAGNRDLLFVLGGVFFALPSFALAIFLPPPQPPKGADPQASLALIGEYYTGAWPALLGVAVLSLLGSMTVLTLFTDRTRPTVGDAIRQGARAMLPVLLAQILFGVALGLALSVVLTFAVATGSAGLKLLCGTAALLGFVYAAVRMALISPVVVVEGVRNPIAAIRRSWDLTKGNAARLLAFFALLLLAFLVIYLLLANGIAFLVALALSGEAAATVNDLISACLQAVLSVYSVAIIAACHRQLAGPGAEAMARPFI